MITAAVHVQPLVKCTLFMCLNFLIVPIQKWEFVVRSQAIAYVAYFLLLAQLCNRVWHWGIQAPAIRHLAYSMHVYWKTWNMPAFYAYFSRVRKSHLDSAYVSRRQAVLLWHWNRLCNPTAGKTVCKSIVVKSGHLSVSQCWGFINPGPGDRSSCVKSSLSGMSSITAV